MILVDVWVAGRPKTKGSMTIRPNGSAYESVIGSPTWRALMAGAVKDDYRRRHAGINGDTVPGPHPGPVAVYVAAHLPPPEDPGPGGYAIRRTWFAKALQMLTTWGWPVWDQSGDLDKLARNVLDAIGSTAKNAKYRGGAITDDVLVCSLVASKHVAGDAGRPPGVSIQIATLDGPAMHGRLIP